MDWEAAIEWNRQALTRVLAALVAMAGLAGGEPTLPRRLHRAVLRLLRPAEAAARRLVIAAARGLAMVEPAPVRHGRPGQKGIRNGAGAGILLPAAPMPVSPPRPGFRLFDPLPRFRPARPAPVGIPRVSAPGFTRPFLIPVRPPPSPDDPIDAKRLALRLAALGLVLDDLPRQARRFARWRTRLDRGVDGRGGLSPVLRKTGGSKRRTMRVWPLGPGRPPGSRRRPSHEVHRILGNAHGLALSALAGRRDTS